MSGHSHWHSIKFQKGIADAKKSKAFSKVARIIAIAAKEGGSDPAKNSKLRIAIDQAKEVNMPKENVERAIKKGSGELDEGERLEEISFEAYGPGGVAVIIDGITDSKKRALGEIKQVLSKNNGKLVSEGAVRWMFERKGTIIINSKDQKPDAKNEDLELAAIEAGADDIYWHKDFLDIYTKIENLEAVKTYLEQKGMKIDSSSVGWVPKETVQVSEKEKEANYKLFEELDENEAVQDIFSNLKE